LQITLQIYGSTFSADVVSKQIYLVLDFPARFYRKILFFKTGLGKIYFAELCRSLSNCMVVLSISVDMVLKQINLVVDLLLKNTLATILRADLI